MEIKKYTSRVLLPIALGSGIVGCAEGVTQNNQPVNPERATSTPNQTEIRERRRAREFEVATPCGEQDRDRIRDRDRIHLDATPKDIPEVKAEELFGQGRRKQGK